MKRLHSFTAVALTGLVGFSSLCAPIAAVASEQGKKNTALGLGAAAVGLLLTQKNKLTGLLAAGGAAYAYSQYDKDVKKRHQREQYGYYDDRSNNDYRTSRDNSNDRYNQDSGYRSNRDNSNDRYNQDNGYRSNRDNSDDRYNQDNGYRYNENRSAHSRSASRRTGSAFTRK